MWIQMKTYNVQTEDDVCDILTNNKTDPFTNVSECVFKNVKKCTQRQCKLGMDIVLFNVHMVPLTIQQTNCSTSLLRGNKKYVNDVHFINLRNKNKEHFSSVVDTLCENDRIFIFNAVIIKNFVDSKENDFIVVVRPEHKSKVFLFKYGLPLSKQLDSIVQQNLSKLTGPCIYSLFGCIRNIKKFTDENCMLLRLQCSDKSCIKIYKYPLNIKELKNISEEETVSGVQYDFASKKVDIMVKSPCHSFISLKHHQRIFLRNVKVKNSVYSSIFSLHVKGEVQNLNVDPIETGSVKSLRPPIRHFPIPNELRPTILPKKEQISCDEHLSSNARIKNVKKNITTFKPLPLSKCMLNLSSSSFDGGDMSPNDVLPTSTPLKNKETNAIQTSSSSNDDSVALNDNLFTSPIIKNKETNYINSSYKNTEYNHFKYTKMDKSKMCSEKENSTDWSSDETLSPPFFIKTPEDFTSDNKTHSSLLNSTNDKPAMTTQCIGPCRLLSVVPNIFENEELVSGYCVKCFSFVQKYILLKSSSINYKCPKCFNIVQLTLFFKMIFLYGKNERQAIEVSCFNENAECVIKKLTKKKICVEDYLTNNDSRQLIITTMKSFINNKTKVNIVVEELPIDNTFKLVTIDTKYIITTLLD